MQFRAKQPAVVDAVRYTGHNAEKIIVAWAARFHYADGSPIRIGIYPLPGMDGTALVRIPQEERVAARDLILKPGEWLVRGDNNLFWPCPDDRFRATYSPLTEGVPRCEN